MTVTAPGRPRDTASTVSLPVRRWITGAYAGRAAAVLAETARALPSLPDASDRAWGAYARAVALSNLGRPDLALLTCTEALLEAVDLPDGGAECVLRLLRVGTYPRLAVDASIVDDLVGAEDALVRTADPAERGWCGFSFGWSCTELHLPEIALAHLEAVPRGPDAPVLLAEQTVLVELCSVTTLLQQADQVELVGRDVVGEDTTGLRRRAAAHARTAAALVAAAPEHPAGWSAAALQVWGATARVGTALSEWRHDPGAAVATARAVLAAEPGRVARTGLGQLPAVLVRSLALLGQRPLALTEGHRLLSPAGPRLSPAGELDLRRALLEVSAAEGDAVAGNALAVTTAQARDLAAEHRRAGAAVHDVLAARRLAAAHAAERRAAREDPLTRVGNRRALDERLAAADGSLLAVLVVDVDDLKTLNDSWGHAVGDEVLVAVAEVLVAQCRADDLVCRTGGDEFAVVAPGADREAAEAMRARVAAAVADLRLASAGSALRGVRLSVGSASSAEGLRTDQLVATADLRMYAAKRAQRRGGPAAGRPQPHVGTGPARGWGGDPVRSGEDAAVAES